MFRKSRKSQLGNQLKVKTNEEEIAPERFVFHSCETFQLKTEPFRSDEAALLPPKLQRRGLVFLVNWLLWSMYDGLLLCVMGYFGIWVIRASGNFIRVTTIF